MVKKPHLQKGGFIEILRKFLFQQIFIQTTTLTQEIPRVRGGGGVSKVKAFNGKYEISIME